MTTPVSGNCLSQTVDPSKRVRDLYMGDIDYGDEFSYSYRGGYEVLTVKHKHGGESEYRGVFHPNAVCEGGGICKWCGCTLGEFGA